MCFVALALSAMPITLTGEHTPEKVLYDLSGSKRVSDTIDAIEKSVDQFAIEHRIIPAQWQNIPAGQAIVVPKDCSLNFSNSASSSEGFFYCAPSKSIYIGYDFAEELSKEYTMATALGIAHEFGHHMQSLKGVGNRGVSPEDAADCVSGAWYAWFNNQQKTHVSIKDLVGIVNLTSMVGRQSAYGEHGTPSERALAIFVGYFGNLSLCNIYFPTL